ncbi:MAG: IS1380 family transposase [Longimicrobiales bacterium]|nr:IS1380 family transposase [Longimicrobiales bacterium]
MAKGRQSGKSCAPAGAPISRVGITEDTLTGRGGLALFSRYIRTVGIFPHLERLFGPLRKSGKGLSVSVLFHQIFCFLMDGTSRHLVYFDDLRADEGYASGIETTPKQMASSHAIKRFFGAFAWGRIWMFRRLLRWLFLWRLKQSEPRVVLLGLDTMVMDNDEALAREGCQPTYKKVKGFQPLQLTWGPFVIDALFRGGKKNGNAGDMAGNLVRDAVAFIRKHYRQDVAIILRLDAGFFDQKLFRLFEALGIGYICSGKLQDDITDLARGLDPSLWSEYDNGHQLWQYFEFGDRRPSWKPAKWRRAFYTRPVYENEQRLLEFARPDNVIYTNLGQGGPSDALLEAAGHADWTRPERIIELHHGRGRDELVHRALKDFRAEQLPFKRFQANAAFYYTVLVAFLLFEAFKQDVSADVVPSTSQATRVRREVIDFAAKIVRTSGQTILKVTAAVWERLRIGELWVRAAHPPPFACA